RCAPSTRTSPASISVLSRARETPGSCATSHRSSRSPAPSAETTSIRRSTGLGTGGDAGWSIRTLADETEREQDHADGDGGVGDVEGGPVPAVPVHVHEVHHRAEARPVDQVAHGAAEDEP